jgi:hypothetical protein
MWEVAAGTVPADSGPSHRQVPGPWRPGARPAALQWDLANRHHSAGGSGER